MFFVLAQGLENRLIGMLGLYLGLCGFNSLI